MFARHFGLRENPFPAGHQLRFLYPSREHQEARAHLRYGIENREPFVLITGEVGTGKTTALYDALAEWGAQVSVALITNSALTRQELLEEICLRFGVALPGDATKPKMLSLLERHLTGVRARGEHAVLLLDEAQNLAVDLLEEIRLLSNVELQGEKLMQIFLVGQPELEVKLSRPELRQLRQRITVHYRLNPLSPEETAGYIHHRISVAGGNAWTIFPPDSCREVYRVTHGIPREINTVASQAMVAAFSESSPTVTAEHVRAAASEGEFRSVLGGGAPARPDAPTIVDTPLASRPVFEPPAAPPPPAPEPIVPRVSPHADAPPAWTPPVLDEPAETVEPVLREELDAWSAAAGDLLKARQRQREGASEPAAAAPAPAPSRAAQAYARADATPAEPAEPDLPRFPTPAELHAMGDQARADNPDISALPQRLRDKIEAEIAAEEHHRHGALPWMIAAAVVALVLVSAVLAQRFGAIDVPLLRGVAGSAAVADSTTHAPATTASATPAPSVVSAPDTAAVPPAPAPAESTKTAAATPTPPALARPETAAPVLTRPAASATSAPAQSATTNVYGIAVGNFLDEARAGQESARLADLTRLSGRVISYSDAGTTMYRVVLGNFTDEASAERSADRVLSQPGVREARVVLLARNVPR